MFDPNYTVQRSEDEVLVRGRFDETLLIRLAREISMDIRPVEDILEAYKLTETEWALIRVQPRFLEYLSQMIQEWESATNTQERVKLKSLAFVEEALPEFFSRAHDPLNPLPAKVEILKTVARFAGIGATVDGGTSGEKLSVTINLGGDRQVRIERDITPRVTPPGNPPEINLPETILNEEDRL